jgi:cell division protein FtsI/penicillin-binding protein 2
MTILVTILLVFIGIIALVLILAALTKKDYYVQRSIVINVPRQTVYDFLKMIQNQEKFNKWAMTDSDRKKEFRGTDGTVGFIYAWSGNKKAGVGEKEITGLTEGKKVETEIRFIKPMAAKAAIVMEMESISANQTKVSLSNAGNLKYPMNIMIPMVQKNFPRDMDESLRTLKKLLEDGTVPLHEMQ